MNISMGNYIGKVEISQGKIVDQWVCEIYVDMDVEPVSPPALMALDFVANGSIVRIKQDGGIRVAVVDRNDPMMFVIVDPMNIENNGTYDVSGVNGVVVNVNSSN